MKKQFAIWILCALFTFHAGAQKKDNAAARRLETIDQLCRRALADFNLPGMAVSIVLNDSVVFSKGYGVRDVRSGAAVDGDTRFAIASNTKAFTAAGLAMMVDEGKLQWDDPVRKYLPWFTLYDPYVSENITIRDLLCHRSGLATFSGDLIWYGTNHPREQVLRNARYLKQAMGFRSGWGYSNILYLAAGEVLEQASGTSWDEFMSRRIFGPLGMRNTNTSVRELDLAGNTAIPHNEVNGRNIAIEYVNWDNIGPAGSINASANDMATWLRLQLRRGNWRGQTLWNEARTWEMWENYSPRPVSKWQREQMPSRHWNGYGLGWQLMEYGTCKVVSHSGGYDGMISMTTMVPELGLGVVILTNNNNSVPSALSFEILDEFTAVKENKDWLAFFLDRNREEERESEKSLQDLKAERARGTQPSLMPDKYCGTYRSEMYGDVVVRAIPDSDALIIDFTPTALFKGELTHWHYDTFRLHWKTQMMLPPGLVTFVLGASGTVEEIKVDVPNPDFDFSELRLLRVNNP